MQRKNSPWKLESSTSVAGEGSSVRVCQKCRWPFSTSHPSQKKRAAHKKQCGKIDGYPLVLPESDGEDQSTENCSGRSFLSVNVEEEIGFEEERSSDKKDTVMISEESSKETVRKSHQESNQDFSQDSSGATSKPVEKNDDALSIIGNKNTIFKHEDGVAIQSDTISSDHDKNNGNGEETRENPISGSLTSEVQQFDEEQLVLEHVETLFSSVDVQRSKESGRISEIQEMELNRVDTKSTAVEGDKNRSYNDELGTTVAAANDGNNSSSEKNLVTVDDELPDSSLTIISPSKDSYGPVKDFRFSVENEAGITSPVKPPAGSIEGSICDPPAEIIQINNDHRSESSTSQDDNLLTQKNELEIQGKKIKEEIKTRAVNWQSVRDGIVAETKKSHIPQKNHEIGYDQQSGSFSHSTETSEIKTKKTSSIKESLRSRLLPDAKKVQKDCISSSPSKLPVKDNNKGKNRGKPQWTPFMCCPTTVK